MTVQATTDGKRVLVRFPYDARLVERVKTIPGRSFRGEDKTWTLPLTMDSCRSLRRVFGDGLEVLRPLADWARAELAVQEALEDVRNGAATVWLRRVEDEAPVLAAALKSRPYQIMGAAFINMGQNVLLGDQPGLGKTLQALAAVIEAGAKTILVACPRTTARSVWERETARWAPHIKTFVAQGTRAERERVFGEFFVSGVRQDGSLSDTPKMLIVNVEMLRVKKGEPDAPVWPFLHKLAWDAIVMDESHQALASTKNVQSKGITQQRYGAVQIRKNLRPDGIALAMSGTPFRSDLAKAWGTLNWLRPDVFTSFWTFAKTHFDIEQDRYGMVVGKEPKDPAAFAEALRPYFLARDKTAAAPDLPPIVYAGTPLPGDPDGPNYVQIDMEPEQETAYRAMAKDAMAAIDGGKLTAAGVLAEITRLRQFALSYGHLVPVTSDDRVFQPTLPSAKAEWILEFLREREGNPGKVVIASSFTSWIKLLAALLAKEGYRVATLTGETSDRDRAKLVKEFQDPDGEVQIAVINTKAGGVGITLDAADDMIITDLPWKSDDERQVTDRIHRVSRIHNVTVYRLLSAGTVDVWMAGLTDEQRRILASADPEGRAIAKEALR